MNDNVIRNFENRLDKAKDLCDLIRENLEDHMGETPDTVNWASVGTADRVIYLLGELACFMNLHDWQNQIHGSLNFVAGEVIDDRELVLCCTRCRETLEVENRKVEAVIPF